jgi:glucan phosphoethanolaminetransferase (alkaline phosphatase superfamily)
MFYFYYVLLLWTTGWLRTLDCNVILCSTFIMYFYYVLFNLNIADSIVEELVGSIRPVLRELDEIQEKIKNMEHFEEIAHEIKNLKKK